MQQRKAIAQAISVLLVTTTTAVALNIAVVQATGADTGSDPAVAPIENAEPQTVVIEIPADQIAAPDPAPTPIATTAPDAVGHTSSAQKDPTIVLPVDATPSPTQPAATVAPTRTAAPPPPTTAAPTTVAPTTAPITPEHDDYDDQVDDDDEQDHVETAEPEEGDDD
jgi:hypothetical protein